MYKLVWQKLECDEKLYKLIWQTVQVWWVTVQVIEIKLKRDDKHDRIDSFNNLYK